MKGISIKGIIIAVLLVMLADTISGIGLMILLGDGWPTSEVAMTTVTTSTPFLLGSLILGTLSTVLGGFMAARIAKTHHYINAAVIGVLGVFLGVLLAGEFPLWFDAIGFLSVIPAALLGGHFAVSSRQGNA